MDATSVEVRRVDRARVDAWLGRIISALLIAILVTGPVLFGALRDQDFFWIQVLGILAAVAWLVRLWLVPRPIFLPPIIWPLVAFCIYGIIRYYTSDVEYLARKEVVRVLFYMMFFVLALNHFRDAKAADIAVGVLLVLAMALSVWALRQYLADSKYIWHLVRPGYTHRGSGTFVYPNHFAGFAEMMLALAFGYLFLGNWSKWTRIFFGYCALWIVVGIYSSMSRAGWIAAVGGLLILLPIMLRNRRRQIVAFIVVVLLLFAGLLSELTTHQMANRLHGVLTNDISGFHSRRALWHGAWQIWRDHPVWGGGPGHFDERFRAYRVPRFQFTAGQAHSDYLNVLADWGAVGALLLLPALLMFLWPLSKHWIKTVLDPTALNIATTNYFALTCGGFAATVAMLAHSAVDYQWYAPGVFLTFIAITAMLISQIQGERWNYKPRLLPLSTIVVLLAVLQSIQSAKSFREQYWIYKAHRAFSMEERIRNLERAFAGDPFSFQTAYWIGESYRALSFEGAANYKEQAERAIPWFDRSASLNRFDPYPHMRKAMCLDWLKRHAEAQQEIQRALALDPEHYFVLAIAGWHYYQVENDETALLCLIASHERNYWNNPVMRAYLPLVSDRLQSKKK